MLHLIASKLLRYVSRDFISSFLEMLGALDRSDNNSELVTLIASTFAFRADLL